MASSPFIAHLRELHAKAKAGTLAEGPERQAYEHGRREVMLDRASWDSMAAALKTAL